MLTTDRQGTSAAKQSQWSEPTDIPAAKIDNDGTPNVEFHQKHREFLDRGKQGDIGLLFLGDSITADWTWGDHPQLFDRYFAQYGLTPEQLERARPDAIVMHPQPMNRGIEIASDVADGRQSVIRDQVRNGVAVRMAVLADVIGSRAMAS